ncbi:MAG: cutinase family protein [Corynebacterium sp.]|nr:cutinase family protein [Corynebacterium sp.]
MLSVSGVTGAVEASAEASRSECVETFVALAPGSLASAEGDDPWNPPYYENAVVQALGAQLREEYRENPAVAVWTLNYAATLDDYDASRDGGTAKLRGVIADVASRCPDTNFVLIGFSQGADIVGDLVSDIGNGRGPVEASRVRGAALLADPRRTQGVGINVGVPTSGAGLEVVGQPLQPLVNFANMFGANIGNQGISRGPRAGGFGVLNKSTFSFCALNDPVCDVPYTLLDAGRFGSLKTEVHTSYLDNYTMIPGISFVQWVKAWLHNNI